MDIGIIGYGKMGKIHYRVLNSLKEEGLVNSIYTYDDMVDTPNGISRLHMHRMDAVIIATPTDTHVAYAKEFTCAGIPVFCEKPLGDLDAGAIMQYSKLFVGYVERYNPIVKRFFRFVKACIIDPEDSILYVKTNRVSALFNDSLKGDLKDREILTDLGVHDYDLINQVFGLPEFSSGRIIEDKKGRAIFAQTQFKLPLGTACDTVVSWIDPVKRRDYIVYTLKYIITLNLIDQTLEIRNRRSKAIELYKESVEPIREELKAFLKFVNGESLLHRVCNKDELGITAQEIAKTVIEKSEVIRG